MQLGRISELFSRKEKKRQSYQDTKVILWSGLTVIIENFLMISTLFSLYPKVAGCPGRLLVFSPYLAKRKLS